MVVTLDEEIKSNHLHNSQLNDLVRLLILNSMLNSKVLFVYFFQLWTNSLLEVLFYEATIPLRLAIYTRH